MEKTAQPGHGDGLGISNSYEDADSALFSGVRFMLAGFDSAARVRLREELETHGGHNLDQFDHSCTHVIVAQQVAYDDPICIAARKGGKSVATETWVSDCLNMGVSLDVNSVLYTPPRDMNGIPGSKSLCICLTGYQGQARQEIMRMVELIGAKFTKPLIASKVTHLICYKFEGDKYLLAKRMGLIKLVNHRWLEDCLKAWKLLPEDKYLRSGWELELAEAEAKDSEDSENIKGDLELLSATKGPLEMNRHFSSINSEATTQQGDLELHSVSKVPVEVNGRFPSINSEASIPQTTLEKNANALGNGAPEAQTQVDVASVNEAVLNVTSLQGEQAEIPVNGNPQDICNISDLAAKPNNLIDMSCTRKALSTSLSPDMPLDSATVDKKPKQPKSTYSRTRKKCKTQDDVARVNKAVVNNTSLQAEQSKADVSPDKSLDSPTVDKMPKQPRGTHSRNRKNSKTDVDVASVNKTLNDKLHCKQSKEDEKPVKRSQEYWFALTGHTHEREKFQGIIKRLGGHICRDQHQWKDRATHFVFPAPLRRTEKFFAAASAGRWILTADYLDASSKAGKFVNEEDYEWHGSGFNEGKTISLEAPRKWRVLRQNSGCGAFFRLKVIVYGECLISPMDTLKRAIKAGGGAVTATSPPYTRPLSVGVDYAIISLGIPEDDPWILQFVKHQVACVREEYFLDYVCKPTSPLDNHILYNTKKNAEAAQRRLKERIEACSSMVRDMKSGLDHSDEDTACDACGRIDREDVMLLCGDGHGKGCGRAMHIDCCRPPLKRVPKDDWFCSQCQSS